MSIKIPGSFVCLAAWLAVSGCSRDPTGTLLARLGDSDPGVRRAAVRTLAENANPDDRVASALTKCVADNDAEVRYFAIAALGKSGPTAKLGVPALKSALQDSEKRVRIRAALALHEINPQDRTFEPVLASAMREGDGKTLLEVGAMGADAAWAVPTLVGLLSHESAQVRVLAANDIGRIGPAANSATSALQAALRDPNAAVKRAAQNALNQIQAAPVSRGK